MPLDVYLKRFTLSFPSIASPRWIVLPIADIIRTVTSSPEEGCSLYIVYKYGFDNSIGALADASPNARKLTSRFVVALITQIGHQI